mgnify:FL=1
MREENTVFKPGDLAVLQNATHYREYNGWLVEILGPASEKWVMDTRIMERVLIYAYPVRLIYESVEALHHKGRFRCMPWQLRPLKGGNSDREKTEFLTTRPKLRLIKLETAGEY